jgi:hypothetical protein
MTLTQSTDAPAARHVTLVVVLALVMAAWALVLVSTPSEGVTEYRYEIVMTSPTPLDYKGVAWAQDGSEAMVVGGIQVLLRFDPETGNANTVGSGNWSSSSQTLEDVTFKTAGTSMFVGGRLDGSTVYGDLWEVVGDSVHLRATVEGDMLVSVGASSAGRLLAIGALGSVFELVDGDMDLVGTTGTGVLYDLAWAPDGTGAFIVGGAGAVAWFDALEGELVDVGFTSTHPLHSVSWRPGTRTAWAVGEGGLVVELNATTLAASRVRPYSPRSEDLYAVSWHPGGDVALVVGEGGATYLWRSGLFTRQLVDVNWNLLDVAWNPVGDEALVACEGGGLLRYVPRLPEQNFAPNAVISSPADGTVVEGGTTLLFDATGSTDPDGDDLAFTWWSNRTGSFGQGAIFDAELPVGSHRVVLYVDDGQDHNVTDEVAVIVTPPIPPEERVHVNVDSPRPGAVLRGTVVFSGTADYDLGEIASVELSVDGTGWWPAEGTSDWTFSLDTTILLDGVHNLQVRVTTDDGASRETSVLIEVRNAVVPEPSPIPNVTLRLRDSGLVDELISFEAEADDLDSWVLVWSFGDGSNGHGVEVRHAYKSAGTYEVTLELWLEGAKEPSAVFQHTIIVKGADELGPSIENLLLVAVVLSAVIYVAGFYGGRRALGRRR